MNRCLVPIARGIERSWKERYTRVSHAKKPSRLGAKNSNGPSQGADASLDEIDKLPVGNGKIQRGRQSAPCPVRP
jgi:hypothetical protein